ERLVLHDLELISGPEAEAAVPRSEHASAGILERSPEATGKDESALVVQRPVVLPDEHRMVSSPRSAPLLSTASHRMPLVPTGQGVSCRSFRIQAREIRDLLCAMTRTGQANWARSAASTTPRRPIPTPAA